MKVQIRGPINWRQRDDQRGKVLQAAVLRWEPRSSSSHFVRPVTATVAPVPCCHQAPALGAAGPPPLVAPWPATATLAAGGRSRGSPMTMWQDLPWQLRGRGGGGDSGWAGSGRGRARQELSGGWCGGAARHALPPRVHRGLTRSRHVMAGRSPHPPPLFGGGGRWWAQGYKKGASRRCRALLFARSIPHRLAHPPSSSPGS